MNGLRFIVRATLAMVAGAGIVFAGQTACGYDPDPKPIVQVLAEVAPDDGDWEEVSTVSYRQPIGHTHTCGNGHTWDHQANPGHQCLTCGLSQNWQDPSPRMVTVVTRAKVKRQRTVSQSFFQAADPRIATSQAPAASPVPQASTVPTVAAPRVYTFGEYYGSSNCTSGGCSSGSTWGSSGVRSRGLGIFR